MKIAGHYATEREVLAIIRRIDTDGDARLNYSEFSDFLKTQNSSLLKSRSFSSERSARHLTASHTSPLKNRASYASPTRARSSAGFRNSGYGASNSFSTPKRGESPLRESRMSPFKTSTMSPGRYTSPSRRTALPLSEEDELVRTLREHIQLEKELDNAKTSLVSKHDFNLFDAFRIFDMNSNGYICQHELKMGLNEIGIFAAPEEIDLFIKRYDKNGDRRLRFSEFAEAFTPQDSYYAGMLNRRTSNDVRGRLYQRDDCFLGDTKIEFRNLWRTHFKVETFAESLR